MTDGAHSLTVFGRRLGELLLRERTTARLTQRALAERAGVGQTTIARWESGARSANLDQIDRVLAALGLQLRLDVEPRVDPTAGWQEEAVRLASLNPAQRLAETKLPLVAFLESAIRNGAPAAFVDGRLASHLQGMPGLPRRLAVAINEATVEVWVTLRPLVRYPVDADLMNLQTPRAEVPELFRRAGGGLLNTIFGIVELRLLAEVPGTVRMALRDDSSTLTSTPT